MAVSLTNWPIRRRKGGVAVSRELDGRCIIDGVRRPITLTVILHSTDTSRMGVGADVVVLVLLSIVSVGE
ncbi:hypothetical protein J6590_021700 [Homalodisca vitripennis]|nr:hypothetical protein J6590_021700 [Homalodisca vitripennis]